MGTLLSGMHQRLILLLGDGSPSTRSINDEVAGPGSCKGYRKRPVRSVVTTGYAVIDVLLYTSTEGGIDSPKLADPLAVTGCPQTGRRQADDDTLAPANNNNRHVLTPNNNPPIVHFMFECFSCLYFWFSVR